MTKALSSVPDHAPGHTFLGLVDILTKRAAEGIAVCEHALELDRNLAAAHEPHRDHRKANPKKKSFSPPETVREQPMARRVLRDHIAHEGKNRDCRAAVDEQAGSKNNLTRS